MSPIKNSEAMEKARNVRLLILDVDGVLTDGRIVIDDRGVESKSFDEKDGHGVKLLLRSRIQVAILSGRQSDATLYRARELGISTIYQKVHDKIAAYEQILAETGFEDREVGYLGDDLVDAPVLRRAGFAAVVADGAEDIKHLAHYTTRKNGGRGAVREVVEFILKSQNKWRDLTARYVL